MREPPARRVVQDPRRLHADEPALRRGEGPRRGRRQRRQPRPGRRARRAAAGHPRDGLHAAGRAAAQARGHPRVRRARRADRPQHRRLPGAGARVRRRDRRRPDPPVRPPRHRRGAGDVRPGDPRAVPRRQHDPGQRGRRRADGGHRHRREGASGRTCGWSGSRPRRPRPTRPPWSRASRCSCTSMATMADGIAVGLPGVVPFAIVRELVDGIETVTEESLSRALLFLLERAKLVVEPAGAAAVAPPARLRPGRLPRARGGRAQRRQHRPDPAAADHPPRDGRRRALPAVPGAHARHPRVPGPRCWPTSPTPTPTCSRSSTSAPAPP